MAFIIYTFLFYISLPFIFIRLVWRARRNPDYAKRWSERLGVVPYFISDCIWWHCVSVGETLAAVPLIKALKKKYPDKAILVTTMTPTGSEQVKKQLGDLVFHVYAPYDLPVMWARFLKKVKPRLLIIMETEIWPNMLKACHDNNIKIILNNARLSEKSYKKYYYLKSSVSIILNYINYIMTQSQEDADRFVKLGVLPDKLSVTGNIKFDSVIPENILVQATLLKKQWGVSRPVFIAASTHPGEEESILAVFEKIVIKYPDLLLILVPRHPERAPDIMKLIEKYNYTVITRTEKKLPDNTTQIFLINTLGELLLFYAASDIAFVGGSLVPHGGHNVLEPAACGLPVMTGEYVYNFSHITELLLKSGGLIKVSGPEYSNNMHNSILDLLANPDKRITMGKHNINMIKQNQGVLAKQLCIIEQYI